jgi:hypothetical protein
MQQKPDPMMILVEGDPTFETVFPELPVIRVRLQDTDQEGESFYFCDGGDYRSGRLSRWRVAGIRQDGQTANVNKWHWSCMLGGIYMRRVLTCEEREQTAGGGNDVIDLPLGDYVSLDSGGACNLQIQYHDQMDIAGLDSVTELIVHASPQLSFYWRPRVITMSPSDRTYADALLASLPTNEPPVVWFSPYREGMQFEGKPRDVCERMYRMGWKALPSLLAALERATDSHERAWYLAMLYSITGLVDPFGSTPALSALGSYRYLAESRSERGGQQGSEYHTVSGPPPSPSMQCDLIESWRSLRTMLSIEDVE